MQIVEYRYLNVTDRVMTGASVQLEITTNNLKNNRVIIDSEKIPFKSQGLVEGGHKNWSQSAKKALEIATEKINNSKKLDIVVKKLEGRIFLDTNNASIGIACILALYKYLEIQPESDTMDIIHKFVKEDWNNDVQTIPDFKFIFEN